MSGAFLLRGYYAMGRSFSMALFNRDGYLPRCFIITLVFTLSFTVPIQQARAWAFVFPAFEFILANVGRAALQRAGTFLVTNGGRVAAMSNAASRGLTMKNVGVGLAGATAATSLGDHVGNIVVSPSSDSNQQKIYAPIDVSLEDGYPRANPDPNYFNNPYSGNSASGYSSVDPTPKQSVMPKTTKVSTPGTSLNDVPKPAYTSIDTGNYYSSDQLFYDKYGQGQAVVYLDQVSANNAYLTERKAYLHKYDTPGQPDNYVFPDRDADGRYKGTSVNIYEKLPVEGTDWVIDQVVGQFNVYSRTFIESEFCPKGYSYQNKACVLTNVADTVKPDNTPCQVRLVNNSFELDNRNPNCNPAISGIQAQVINGAIVFTDSATGRQSGVIPKTATNPMTVFEQDGTARSEVQLGEVDNQTGLRPVITLPPISKPLPNHGLGEYAGTKTGTQPGTDTGEGGISGSLPAFCTFASVVCDAIEWLKGTDGIPEEETHQIEELDHSNLPTNPDFSFSQSCPAPLSIPLDFGIVSSSIEISYEPFCQFFAKARPFIIAAAYLHGAFIISGFRKET